MSDTSTNAGEDYVFNLVNSYKAENLETIPCYAIGSVAIQMQSVDSIEGAVEDYTDIRGEHYVHESQLFDKRERSMLEQENKDDL
uniref:Uncharacterized protein n=1 Tax=Trichogramma kaykai TaxID=54128 RepID=A0ABD2X488_9HYME